METTLSSMRDQVWATVCTLAENEGITFSDCLSLAMQVLNLLLQIPMDVSFQTQIPLTIAYCPESSIYRRWCPHKKIAKGITGWAIRDTMICDLPEHRKAQPNHPDPVGPPLDYMGECQVFNGIWSDIYDLCQFYILGMTGDLPEFPAPWEPATCGQIRDLLKSTHAIGQPYMILVHSADSVTAVSMLRELHTAACL